MKPAHVFDMKNHFLSPQSFAGGITLAGYLANRDDGGGSAAVREPARDFQRKSMIFQDRADAGQRLGEALGAYANRLDVLVLALPRGGVPVAAEVAKKLNLPVDVLVVRKLGVPFHRELGMGAIASGGVRIVNKEVVDALGISSDAIETVVRDEQHELERREKAYRGDVPPPKVEGKTVILVDDGIATGSTMLAAIEAVRHLKAARVIVAVPTAAASTCEKMREAADDVVALLAPEEFYAVGQWYENFAQTSDDEVRELLAESTGRIERVVQVR
jgi:predicted phosphoribosyltransferase